MRMCGINFGIFCVSELNHDENLYYYGKHALKSTDHKVCNLTKINRLCNIELKIAFISEDVHLGKLFFWICFTNRSLEVTLSFFH